MASKRETIDHVLSCLGPEASARAMFGEYGLYVRGVLVGSICDDRLFLKETEAGARLLGALDRAPPYPGAKPAIVVPAARWDTPTVREAASATATALGTRARAPRAAAKRSAARPPRRR